MLMAVHIKNIKKYFMPTFTSLLGLFGQVKVWFSLFFHSIGVPLPNNFYFQTMSAVCFRPGRAFSSRAYIICMCAAVGVSDDVWQHRQTIIYGVC